MSKFKVSMKLTGFELEIEGSREDVPLITQNLSHQLGALLKPSGAILEGEVITTTQLTETISPTAQVASQPPERKKARRRHRTTSTNGEGSGTDEAAIDWKHDPAKHGTPKQGWVTAQKAIWILYVVELETAQSELSTGQIAATFNKHFKQAGPIRAHNVSRDLGKLKVNKNGLSQVSENTTKNPSTWFLTDEGKRIAQNLVAEALGQPG